MTVTAIDPREIGAPRRWADGLPTLDADTALLPHPDGHWVIRRGNRFTGRCSAWWRNRLPCDGHRVGVIGHFGASDQDAAGQLLRRACRSLQEAGCSLAIGPMDGDTWGRYRFVTEWGTASAFWPEPNHPRSWPNHFRQEGFQPCTHYFSAINTRLTRRDPRLPRVTSRLSEIGVAMRPLRRDARDQDLRSMRRVVHGAFLQNPFYTELSEQDFLDRHRHLDQCIPLDFVWIAEHDGHPIGFVFAYPDPCEKQRTGRVETVVVKTLATLPSRAGPSRRLYAGLGQWMLEQIQQQAHQRGFTRVIHALVRDVPHLRRISERYAQPMRRYTLFAKVLRP
jgi:hypothetical protein